MKLLILALCLLSLAANPQSESPSLLSPINGATVSGTINVTMPHETGLTNPVAKIEFYRDGVLIGTVYPPLPPPRLTILAKQ